MYLGRHPWIHQTKGDKRFPRSEADIKKDQDAVDKEEERCKKLYGKNYQWAMRVGRVHKIEYRYVTEDRKAKKHIFVSLDGGFKTRGKDHRENWNHEMPYFVQSGFTKLSERLTEEADPHYAEAYEKLMRFKYITGKRSKPKPRKRITKKKTKKKVKKA